jgi:uncharacterized lipoprotein
MSLKAVNLLGAAVCLTLSGCGTEELHYTDTAYLEQPPTIAANQSPELEAPQVDESVVSSPHGKVGMGDKVELTDSVPPVLKIRQPLAGAWNTVYQALKQKNIEIKDFEKDKALYYVVYEAGGFLGSLFSSTDKQPIYLLTLTEEGGDTNVTAALASKSEQNAAANPDAGNDSDAAGHAKELLQVLYETMRDELVKK